MLEMFLRELFLKGAGIFSLFNSLDLEPGFCFFLPKGYILYRGWACRMPSQLSFRRPQSLQENAGRGRTTPSEAGICNTDLIN